MAIQKKNWCVKVDPKNIEKCSLCYGMCDRQPKKPWLSNIYELIGTLFHPMLNFGNIILLKKCDTFKQIKLKNVASI